ncbi:hypothetical protein [Dactylosporangium sp. CS-033363]|uniref:hypothetical protein n=1 Tax=Dactylosporangium sp. CS-033363 TaxID=3239935 RepID=UPI003D8BBCF7
MNRTVALLASVLLLAACTPSGPPPKPEPVPSTAPAPCRTEVLAGWSSAGLAVLWVARPIWEDPTRMGTVRLPTAVTAIDVRTGQVRSYCPLPAPPTGPVVQEDHKLAMRQGGTAYPPYLTDTDLLLRTQYFSPDFRWFAAPGLPLIDVATGRPVPTDWPGTAVGLSRDLALIKTGASAPTWCTRSLPPKTGEPCTPLTVPASEGAFVIGSAGTPTWVPAATQPYVFGAVTGYAITDGTRIYGAEDMPAAERALQTDGPSPANAPIDIDPAGLGGFITIVAEQPPAIRRADDWFTVESVGDGQIRTRYHHTTARGVSAGFYWMWGDPTSASRAIADGGKVAVTTSMEFQNGHRSTRFGALVDGTDQVIDLTQDRGLHCPQPDAFCHILAWPDGSIGTTDDPPQL